MAFKKSNNSVAEELFLLLLQFEIEAGASNENIVQNHLNQEPMGYGLLLKPSIVKRIIVFKR